MEKSGDLVLGDVLAFLKLSFCRWYEQGGEGRGFSSNTFKKAVAPVFKSAGGLMGKEEDCSAYSQELEGQDFICLLSKQESAL